jgi:hypothetical protein
MNPRARPGAVTAGVVEPPSYHAAELVVTKEGQPGLPVQPGGRVTFHNPLPDRPEGPGRSTSN